MKLSIGERYVLGELLPKEASFKSLKILRALKETLSYSEEDLTLFNIRSETAGEGSVLRWDTEVPDAEIEIGAHALTLIQESLAKLDAEQKVTEREFSLYSKFMDTEGS